VELHLFYNAVVFAPMLAAMLFHLYPTREEQRESNCTCAVAPRPRALMTSA